MEKRVLFVNIRSHKIERMEPFYIAKKLNLRVTVIADSYPSIDSKYIDDVIISNTYNKENCLAEVIKYNDNKKIDAVVTWADKDVELVAMIGEALNLPTVNREASINARNKYVMRSRISEKYPKLCPKFKKVRNYEELVSAAEEIKLPAIFKPVGASGSKSIFKIEDKNDLESIYNLMIDSTSCEKDKVYSYFPSEYIFEEFMEGKEISLEGLVQGGEIIIAGVTDKKVTKDFSLEYQEIFPSQEPVDLLRKYGEEVKKSVQALRFNNCSFHAECKILNGELKIIEIAARPGGGFIASHLIEMVSGISFHEQVLKIALGEEIDKEINIGSWINKKNKVAGHIDLLADKEGTLKDIKGIDSIFEDKNIKIFIQTKQINERVILPPKDFGSLYIATSVILADNYEQVNESIERIKDKVQIIIE